MGKRGPKPGTGGRPKKPLADKITDGNPGKRPLTVIDFKDNVADLEGQVMPKPSDYLSATLSGWEGFTFSNISIHFLSLHEAIVPLHHPGD